MKQYKFKLDSILSFRERMEDQLKGELSDIGERLAEEEKRLADLNDYCRMEGERMLEREEITPLELSLYNGYLKGIRHRIEDGEKLVEEWRARVEKKREELVEAAKEKKILEVMKGKDQKQYQVALGKIEQRMLDEHSVNAFSRDDALKGGADNA